MTCTHPGPHLLPLHLRYAGEGPLLINAVEIALNHTTSDTDETTLSLVQEDVNRWANLPAAPNGLVQVNTSEYTRLQTVLDDAIGYMLDNNYAGDEDFPEDSWAAQLFTLSPSIATACLAGVVR